MSDTSIEMLRSSIASMISDLATQLDVQLARSNALAAENAGLKTAIDATIGWQQSTDSENVESVRMLVDVKTPATDASLAEVRAQGVEMFAAHKRERQQALRSRSMRMSEEAAGMAADAENFADELRKGVQS
ncbi:hypothetical protein [Enterobacter hormaechei]|uniref:hypothetical protein n=1 Tax=Enterobacter hormaechei TaxID=158836 RepID=UPI003F556574